MPKHIARLVLLIIGFGALALAAKSFFTVDSFYRFGHYRADSVPEIAALTPAFQTPKACQTCHAPRHAEWSGANHKSVICEACHGAAPGHPDHLKVSIPTDTQRLCTQCHEQMPGRPSSSVRQIDPGQHYPSATQCIACHNPHAPKIEAAAARPVFDRKAAVASAAVCAGCHGESGTAANEIWPNLAGQNAAYLARSLGAFKTGARTDATMAPMAQAVADDDVPNLAAYFSSLSCGASGRRGSGDAAAGKVLAKQCTACHGESGRPVNTSWPRLAGQNPGYLANALTAFREGQRSDPFMSPVAHGLSDADIANLATYFAALSCGATSK
ncbi:exported hypothetical protein [Burkholderiales bacterium]|nr:exported hypothetical protein [Burkholderiales bacterium]